MKHKTADDIRTLFKKEKSFNPFITAKNIG